MRKKKEPVIKPCGCSDEKPPHVCKICFDPGVKENTIKAEIIRYLESLPCCQVTEVETGGRRRNGYIKPKESEGVGRADLFICYYGFYIELETKKPKGKKRESQIERVPKIKKALGQYWFAESLGEVILQMEKFKSENKL